MPEVTRVTLKRTTGTPAEIHAFKKGYKVSTLAEADAVLADWSQTVAPHGEDTVAYTIEFADGSRHYGTYVLCFEPHGVASLEDVDEALNPMDDYAYDVDEWGDDPLDFCNPDTPKMED